MARIIIPRRFYDQAQLIKDVKTKHDADLLASSSILTAFFTENGINITDDDADADAAKLAHAAFDTLGKNAEKFYKERDRLFDPIFANHRTLVQYLKKLFIKNIGKLGDFGITVNGKRIVYPTDILEKMDAVEFLINKHYEYPGDTSPLTAFLAEESNQDINLTTNLTNTGTARTRHHDAEQANKNKETKRVDRDLLMVTPVENITLTGNFLVGHFSNNPNKAGDWKFTVDTSPKGTKVRSGTVNIGSDKVLANLAVGGVLVNNSEFNILIFKGKTPTGTPVTLIPGKPFLIVTGYGTLTVRNPNAEQKAAYQGVFHV